MLWRIVFTVLVLFVSFLTIQIMEQKIAPSHAADLAIEQVTDPGAMVQMRIEQNSQNWLDPIVYICTIVLLFFIWIKPFQRQLKKMELV